MAYSSKRGFYITFLFTLLLMSKNIVAQSELSFDKFTQEEGLSNNIIQCIYQDTKGWIWIGTNQGLSRFDGYGFTNFLPSNEDSTSLKGSIIRVITETHEGTLLVGTETGGLNVFDRQKETFSHPLQNSPCFSKQEISVNDIIEDNTGTLWLATDFNVLKIDSTGKTQAINPEFKKGNKKLQGTFIRKIKFDTQGILWIGSNDGIFLYNKKNNSLNTFPLPYKNQNKEIWQLFLDDDGMMWAGTYSSGLFIVNPQNYTITKVGLIPSLPRTETVRAISKGIYGYYWIGTRGGLFQYSKDFGVNGFYRNNLQDSRSLASNSILSILHDSNGETWVGTRNGLNLLAKKKQVFHNYTAHKKNNKYLNSATVYAIWMDKENKIWLGTEDGGINIYNPATGTYKYITTENPAGYALSKNCIKSLVPDQHNNLWVATFMGGVDLIDLATKKIKNFRHSPGKSGSLSDNRIWDICINTNGQVWIATYRGLDCFNPETSTFIHYPQINGSKEIFWIEPDSKGNLWMGSSDEVIFFNPKKNKINRWFEHSRSMFEDSQNQIWIATKDKGIATYSEKNGPIKYYTEKQGLANNQALCILEDNANNLWISTTNGLSKFSPKTGSFHNFTSKDGLGNNHFCYNAALKTPKGKLIFGSVAGFNIFKPDDIIEENTNIPLVFTGLKVFNKNVPIKNDKKSVLKQSITETRHLTFNYKQNVFTLEFAALNYVNSDNNLYSYKLDGFDANWSEPAKNRTATYTNLNQGDYTLRIKRIIPDRKLESQELNMQITILPPFWETHWFLSIILLLIILLGITIIRFFVNREKIKSQLIIERSNAQKLHEVDRMKLKFFTNISHEIRTPLTLILGPLKKIIESENITDEIKDNLQLMQRNARNLDRLISQLLDFRKLQSGNLKLNLTEADLVSFIRNIVGSFNNYAADKNIKLTFNTLKKRIFTTFDPDKIEKIINNLLSNAIKYTDDNGSITVNLSLIFDTNDDDFEATSAEKQYIEIIIKDTGKGISHTNIDRIFMRFFQSNEKDANSGAGIGLALVKDLVKLHKGNIFVTSKEGKGTRFTIRLPYNMTLPSNKTETDSTDSQTVESKNTLPEITDDNKNNKIILIVEDNADVRHFICSHFNTQYKVHQAINGEDGWKKALELVPDIIISDIIMPTLNGYELCKRLKNDERTSHIPIILLTAMHSKEHEIKGLTQGADDYITKPFDLLVLQAKVENILSIRESLKEKYVSTMVLEPTNIVLSSPDEKFLKRVIDVVEENIADSELDIENFALKVGVSRMQLYRKLHALTNMTVKEFIRDIRLKRAVQLLEQGNFNISEIAYKVGFKDLSHFRKCFKREYGMSATEYLAQKKH